MKTSSAFLWDWPLALLTIILAYSAATRLSITNWTPGLWSIEGIAVIGATLGLLLGISRFQNGALRWLVTGYTVMVIPWLLTGLVESEQTAIGKLASLAGRFDASTSALWRGEPVTDSLYFVTLMCILFWFTSLVCGYQVIRKANALGAIFPVMLPLLVVQYYDSYASGRIWILGVFFLAALLLIGRLNFNRNRERWKKKLVFATNESEFDIARGLLVTALAVIFIAWTLPTPAAAIPAVARLWKEFSQPFESTRDRLDDLLASLQGGVALVPGELYGNTMNLGQSAQQGDIEVFRVKPSEFTPVRQYWRVRVYDRYDDNGEWSTFLSQEIPFAPDDDLAFLKSSDQTIIDFVFNWRSKATSILVTPGEPRWVSRVSNFQVNPFNVDSYDILSWSVLTPIQPGDQYRVQSILFNPTVKDLRAASTEYPAWVSNRYLSLPDDLSVNIRRLAERLTKDHDNNFDKANAITNYLRTEMEYTLEVSPPPAGVDPVEWFLFSWKSGFCNYYASAEVLLLRAVGIPARMVVGYAPGDYQPDGSYQVRAKDAHAWPEVYFTDIGWVAFEPTASQSVIFRPSGEERAIEDDDVSQWRRERLDRLDLEDSLLPDDNLPAEPVTPAANETSVSSPWFQWLWVVILTAMVLGATFVVLRLERQHSFTHRIPGAIKRFYIRYHLNTPMWLENWVRWSEVSAVERAFHAINQSLGWLGQPQAQNVTALERAALLKELVPDSSEAIDALVAAHEKTLYTPEPANPSDAIRAAWGIRYQALRALLRRSLVYFNGE